MYYCALLMKLQTTPMGGLQMWSSKIWGSGDLYLDKPRRLDWKLKQVDNSPESWQPDRKFVVYDHETRESFDERSRKLLDQLYAKFSHVEISDISCKKWCVRVIRQDKIGEPLPLAAIGNSPHQAAERLWRISTFF